MHTTTRRRTLKSLGVVGAALTGSGTALGQGPTVRNTSRGGETELTLLHDTHFHGRFSNLFVEELNIANYFGLMNDIADRSGAVLKLGNGDDLASSVLSSVFDGKHITDAFNAGGLDYDTYGNHDFDMGPDTLTARVGDSDFTWVSANVLDDRTGDVFAADAGAERYVITEVSDGGGAHQSVPVGITGLITPEAPEITSIGENAVVLDPVDAMREVMPQMRRDGAKVIIVQSHLANSTAERVAENVGNLDVIVGDHAASVLEEPKVVHDTLLSFVGDQFEFIGELTLTLKGKTKSIAHYDFTLHDVGAAVEGEGDFGIDPDYQDSAVAAVMRDYLERLSDKLDVVIGQTNVPLDTREEVVRTEEAAVGNFVADAERTFTDAPADVALMNGGGIRTDTLYFEDATASDPADITKRLVFAVLPFGNSVVKLEVDGQDIVDALENGVSKVEDLAGRFPQVSGMQFTWDPDAPAGDRVTDVTVGGDPVDTGATYTLATNNFVADGGDGYDMFEDRPRLVDENAGPLLAQLVVDEIKAKSPISPAVEGRITEAGSSSSARLTVPVSESM